MTGRGREPVFTPQSSWRRKQSKRRTSGNFDDKGKHRFKSGELHAAAKAAANAPADSSDLKQGGSLIKLSQDLKRTPGSPIVPEDVKSEKRLARLQILGNPPAALPDRPDFTELDKALQPEHFVADAKAKALSEWADAVIEQQEDMAKFVQALQEECRYVEKWGAIVRDSEKQHVEQVAAWEKTGEAGRPPTNEMQIDILRYYLKKTTVNTTKSGNVVHLQHSHNFKCNFDPNAKDEQGRKKCFTWQICQHCCETLSSCSGGTRGFGTRLTHLVWKQNNLS